ncbi:hypothetical protein PoB_005817400 [Plakobranchus ocellatus]|uniref:Reverse transcriptase domain-containing protein n=1 Tax=Plakobranchus ocellatus TaxID=259542 RepID=A0AAV4CG21_9GAST|nr:hypothetical protein PoB_005817400 [Plakobranchus ocellatus]
MELTTQCHLPPTHRTPQGDSLSPVLFIVYLEHALRDIRPVQNDKQEPVPAEIIYADDIDFIGKKDADVNSIEKTLKTHCLKVNVDKTEHTSVRKDSEDWKTTKKADLDTLRLIAEDRPKWNALVAEIRKTAEAARSDDPASGRL